MRRNYFHGGRAVALATGFVALTSGAFAQSLLSTTGTVIATVGDAVPDTTGTPIPNMLFVNSFDSPSLDDTGNLVFRGRFADTPTTVNTWDDRAYFYGSTRANLTMVQRGGDQAPGMAPGILLRSVTGSSVSLTSTIESGAAGHLWWGSNIVDNTGTGLVTSGVDDWGFFGGPVGAQTLLLRRGDAAPGTVGATITQNSVSGQNSGINRQGRIFLSAALTGGDVTTTSGMNNQTAYYAGFPGALELVVRKSGPVSGIPGEFAIDTSSSIGFILQMNDSGQLFYELTLSPTQGSATAANDKAYMVHTPGAGSAVLVRENDFAPGTIGASFNALSGNLWSIGQSGNSFTRTSKTVFTSTLTGGDVSGTANDSGIFAGGVGSLALRVRKGDAAPGTDALFEGFSNASVQINGSDSICFQAFLSGGTSSTTDDTGIWSDHGGTLTLIAREGQVMPGTGGSVASSMSGTVIYFNDAGQILFTTNLSGGTITGTSYWAYDPTQGLLPVSLAGDSIEIAPGVFRFMNGGFSSVGSFNNSDGRTAVLGHDGRFAVSLSVNDGGIPVMNSQIIMMGFITPATTTTAYCFGDGSGAACPCANNGVAGNGCANSVNVNGANLAGSGIASISVDTYLLSGTGMPNSSVLYFQGTAPASTPFGDGIRCAGGSIIRLGTTANTGGASQYPNVGNQPISIRGLNVAGNLRYYQAWYRNAAAFCSADTFNLTNGVSVTWVP